MTENQKHFKRQWQKQTRHAELLAWEANSSTEQSRRNCATREYAERMARYGHRDWLVWHDRGGVAHAARKTADSVKAALVASGTQKKFVVVRASNAGGWLINWRTGINILHQCRYGI